jgi:hypothetical protein
MPRSDVFVGDVEDLSPTHDGRAVTPGRPPSRHVTVTFARGRKGVLDVSDPRSAVWAGVLASLRETGQPAYVRIDPESGMISDLLLPLRYTVAGIRRTPEGDGDLEVELVISQARHFLRRSNPDFDELRAMLETALKQGTTVLVTETRDEHDIIDVRLADRPPEEQV